MRRSAGSSLMVRMMAVPSTSGNIQSTTTTSGRSRVAARSPSSPLAAATTA
jgi:hypothetical protein